MFQIQVKLAYQETELLNLLKKITLGPAELNVLREKAEQLRDGTLKSRGDALLPLTLASFIFDSLCLPCTYSTIRCIESYKKKWREKYFVEIKMMRQRFSNNYKYNV